MRWLVIQYKIVSLEYFMDEMQLYELYAMLKEMKYAQKDHWEQTRAIMFATLKPYLKEDIKDIKDFWPLETDEEYIDYYESSVPTKEDYDMMLAEIEQQAKRMKL